MINEENLVKLYEGILDNKELTTKELNSYGFNSKDLSDLIENKKLERIKRGYYSLLSIDDLFYYGKKLISMKEYNKATVCFEKCYALNPNHLGACFQLLLRSIQSRNYDKAFEYIEHLYDSENKYYIIDNNFYLYLLSMITEIPEKYREYVRHLKLEDIKVANIDKRYSNINLQNKIRMSALNQRFTIAEKQLNQSIQENNNRLTVQDIIIKVLLNQAIKKQLDIKTHINKLIKRKDYNKIIEFLEAIQTKHNLRQTYEYMLSLTKDIIYIMKTNIIPKKQILKVDTLFDAIDSKNYELALSLCEEFNKNNNIDQKNNYIYLLLKEINNIINKIKETKKEDKPSIIENKEEQKQKCETKENIIPLSSSNTFADIIGYLMNNDLDNAFLSLKNYLNSIEKLQYNFLIINLIKISLLEKDMAFTKPMIALTYITKENFEFNISEYIQKFYETLAESKLDQAKIYLDIISKSNDLEQHRISIKELEIALNNIEKITTNKINNEPLNQAKQSTNNINNIETSSSSLEQSQEQQFIELQDYDIFDNDEIKIQTEESDTSKIKDYDDSKLINSKLDRLYEKGIVLLKPMDNERIKGIHNIVKDIPDVASFSIGEDNKKQVVLRFKPYIYEHIDFSAAAKEGNSAYSKGEYDDCIESYKKLLECGTPKAYVYAKLGLAYMKKFDKKTAIDYLTIATELNKKENGNEKFDFTELIASLNGLISEDDRKYYVKMKISDFNNDIDNYYGIKEINQIAELISLGVSIDDAYLNANLDDEQKNIVTLIFARENYANGDYNSGDQYLKKVEKVKNKSKFVASLYEEIKRNKKFYKNRVRNDQKQLLLTSKNNKQI